MEVPTPNPEASSRPAASRTRRVLLWAGRGLAVAVLLVAVLLAGLLVSTRSPADRMFRGKLESEWIAGLKYNDEEQVKEWREYGEEGIEVLFRGYERECKQWERRYRRQIYPLLRQYLPVSLMERLPSPGLAHPGKRMSIASLIDDLEPDPAIAFDGVMNMLNDELGDVQHIALLYFNGNYRDQSPVLQLSARQREELLKYLLNDAVHSRDGGVRNNGSATLRFFPKEKSRVAPALLTVIRNPEEELPRATAAESLFIVAPETADCVEVVDALIDVLRYDDGQIAYKAPELLAKTTVETDRVVEALIAGLKHERLVSIACARALPSFPGYADQSVPALLAAHDASDINYQGWFRSSIEKLDPASAPPAPTTK